MTTAELGEAFIEAVRQHLSALATEYALREVGSEITRGYAALVMANAQYYLRCTCDFRDRWLDIGVGRITEGVVPPIPIAPSRTPDRVRELGSSIIIWHATGDRTTAFALGEYAEETPAVLTDAVARLATSFTAAVRPILNGDKTAWMRVAELTVFRC